MKTEMSLQKKYAPQSICYGCGPSNPKGLHVESFVEGDKIVARFKPEPHHHAFPGVVNGGIIGSLLDCHSNWTAAYHLMNKNGLSEVPCTVTADYAITLKRPTPMDQVLELKAWVVSSEPDRAVIEAELVAGGKVCASCRGTFVAVKPGHPAYHRWG